MSATASSGPMPSGTGRPPGAARGSTDFGRVPELLAAASILTISMIIVVVLRMFLRLKTGIKAVRLVDWMNVLAALFSVAVSIAVVISVRFGVGRHIFDVSGADTIQGLKYYWISKLLYIAATWVVKMAVFTTLLGFANAPPQQGRVFLKTMLYCAMVFMTAYSVVFWVAAVVECRPARFIFNKSGIRDGQCMPGYLVKGFENAHASMNTAMDLFYVLLTVFMVIYGVRRSIREKFAIAVVFILGFFAVGAAGVHALYEFGYNETNELLYDSAYLLIWAMVEINVGLIAINLPSLSPLFHKFLQPKRSPTRNSTVGPTTPSTPTPSTLLAMTQLNRSESQHNIVDRDSITYQAHARPAPPFVIASSSSARYSSDSKTNLSEIMVQVDFDMEQHPAFREREKPVLQPPPQPPQDAATGTPVMGHRRMPTPMMF